MNLPLSRSAKVRGDAGLNNSRPVQLTGYPIIDPNPQIQNEYLRLRAHGESHNIAEMLATRSAPNSRSDADFFRGMGTLDKQIGDDPHSMQQVVDGYRAATGGRNPNPNYSYQAGLAQFPGDPRAFVGGAGEIKRRAEELNVNVEGFVTHKASEPIVDPFTQVGSKAASKRATIAPDLKQMIVSQMEKRDPSLKGRVNPGMLDAVHGNHVKER